MNDSEAAVEFLKKLDVPFRSAVSLDVQTVEAWRDSRTGLNPVQAGMQVAIPEIDGATEPFVRDKAVSGVRKACKGRPVTEDQLAHLGQDVEDALRLSGAAEIPANEVGLAILGPLRDLDEVAYLRFASVYRAFESADDFEDEIALLRAERVPDSPAELTSAPSG